MQCSGERRCLPSVLHQHLQFSHRPHEKRLLCTSGINLDKPSEAPSIGVYRLDSTAGVLSYVLVKPIQQTRTFGPQKTKASPAWPTTKAWCPHCDACMALSMVLLSVWYDRLEFTACNRTTVDGVEGIASVRSYLVDGLNPRGCCMGTVELLHKTGATPSRD